MFEGLFQQLQDHFIAPLCQTDPACMTVVDEYGPFSYLRVMGVANTADVVSIAEGKQRKDADGCVFNGMYPPHKMQSLLFHQKPERFFDFDPEPDGFKGLGRQVKGKYPHEFLPREGPFFISCHVLGNLEPSLPNHKLRPGHGPFDLDDLCFLFRAHMGKVFQVRFPYHDVLFVKNEAFNHILVRPMKVDGPFMAFLEGPYAVNGAHGLACSLFEDRVAFTAGANVHVKLGITPGTEPGRFSVHGPVQQPFFFQGFQMPAQIPWPERLIRQGNGPFGRRTGQVRTCNMRIMRVQDRRLKRSPEKIVRVFHEILIQGIRLRKENDEGFLLRAAHAPSPLPGVDDRSRISYQQADVQVPDVYPQLQSAGGNHSQEAPLRQFFFNTPPLLRQKTGPV